jgi:hypothetical protein
LSAATEPQNKVPTYQPTYFPARNNPRQTKTTTTPNPMTPHIALPSLPRVSQTTPPRYVHHGSRFARFIHVHPAPSHSTPQIDTRRINMHLTSYCTSTQQGLTDSPVPSYLLTLPYLILPYPTQVHYQSNLIGFRVFSKSCAPALEC